MEDYDISFISGKIHLPPDSSFPILDVMPIEEYAASDNPVYVGEIKLTELKRVLQLEGIIAEFKGEGVLVCNEKVAIRKVRNNSHFRWKRVYLAHVTRRII